MGFIFVFSQNVSSQEASSNPNPQNLQFNYKRVLISNINDSVIEDLHDLGIDLTCGAVFENQQLTIELKENQLDLLQDQNINYNVL